MSSRQLEVPDHVRYSDNVVVGDVDAFMASYEIGEQYEEYLRRKREIYDSLETIIADAVRFFGNHFPTCNDVDLSDSFVLTGYRS